MPTCPDDPLSNFNSCNVSLVNEYYFFNEKAGTTLGIKKYDGMGYHITVLNFK